MAAGRTEAEQFVRQPDLRQWLANPDVSAERRVLLDDDPRREMACFKAIPAAAPFRSVLGDLRWYGAPEREYPPRYFADIYGRGRYAFVAQSRTTSVHRALRLLSVEAAAIVQ